MATKKVIKNMDRKTSASSKSSNSSSGGNSSSATSKKQESEQNKYMQLQMIDQQVRQLQQYLQSFDQQLTEIRNVIIFLKELSKLKKGDQIFAPITNGVFVKARLENNKEVKVNVGNNVVVTKSIDEAVKMLQGQEAEITNYRSDLLAKFDQLIKQAEVLQSE